MIISIFNTSRMSALTFDVQHTEMYASCTKMIYHVEFKNEETNAWKRNELREIVSLKSAKFGKFRLFLKEIH
jgi:hypothetical protein